MLMTINWDEIFLITIGAVLGFLLSIITTIIQRKMDRNGKLHLFYRFVHSEGISTAWGFDDNGDGRLSLTIPVVFEFQNTSNTTRVIRDVSFLLYNENKLVDVMMQIDHVHTTKTNGKEITDEKDLFLGDEKGSYSFVLPPRSIQRRECEYCSVIHSSEKDKKHFTRIVARYFDERNKPHFFNIKKIDGNWMPKRFSSNEEWVLMK